MLGNCENHINPVDTSLIAQVGNRTKLVWVNIGVYTPGPRLEVGGPGLK